MFLSSGLKSALQVMGLKLMVYQNLTKGRVSEVGRAYSLTMVTEGRVPYFNDLAAARCLINEMRRLHESKQLESLAWVLMPDHLHWLLVLEDKNLSELMRLFKGVSSQLLNKQLQRQGTFWQRGFYDHAVRKEEGLRAAARYIVGNPLRAGLVETLADYPHWDAKWLVD